jgi:uncharacterized DUF497 family protein
VRCFEWNPAKAAENRRKHGVRFEDAITAFDDPFALIRFDDAHSDAEVREILLGHSARGLLVVVFTVRTAGITRIIGARKPTRRERNQYEEGV